MRIEKDRRKVRQNITNSLNVRKINFFHSFLGLIQALTYLDLYLQTKAAITRYKNAFKL